MTNMYTSIIKLVIDHFIEWHDVYRQLYRGS